MADAPADRQDVQSLGYQLGDVGVGTTNVATAVGDAQTYGCYLQIISIGAGRGYWYGSIKADARL